MCTAIRFTDSDGNLYFGRNLDWAYGYGETITFTPRNHPASTGHRAVLGMAIDAERQRPVVSTVTGGLSGPCVKPIALRMVWQVFHAVQIPIVGLGGIMNATDAVESLLAGARAIEIGTANFIDPQVTLKVIDGIDNYLDRHGCRSVDEIIGALKV